eukprot:scaffold306507_cov47-Prasinocladus_malaysianus.AAC.1
MVSPIAMAKAVKNEAEMAGMAEAHLRDGVAVARFLCQLERAVSSAHCLEGCVVLPVTLSCYFYAPRAFNRDRCCQ